MTSLAKDLPQAILDGSRLALARLLTRIENGTSEGYTALARLFSYTGRAHLVGITGAPGTGKSSLVNQLARYYRNPPAELLPLKVGIVAVDPSSPFSGGAILGDRVRMRDLAGDPGVFIRSMASRGSLGGLAAATSGVVQALDAAGFDVILIETVGAGQAEVDIARLAHTTLVIEAPGLGDDIQAIKAGILEIADILVINKADRPGVENTERALRNMLQLAHPIRKDFLSSAGGGHHAYLAHKQTTKPILEPHLWSPPVLRTVATEGIGIETLYSSIQDHRKHLAESGEWEQREQSRMETELAMIVQDRLMRQWRSRLPVEQYQQILDAVYHRRISPWQAAEQLTNGDNQ
jgi:LAO/AO transport system kinase